MIGIDLGSRNIKIVRMKDKAITDYKIFDTVEFYRQYGHPGKGGLKIDLTKLGLGRKEDIVATGYGKIAVRMEGAVHLPEIHAHVRGAVFQTGLEDFTLIDMGGQAAKIIKVQGCRVVDSASDERCAATSGRYLENMAALLGISLEELSLHSQDPVEFNSTCAIFGETEVIAKIMEGYSVSELAAGINYSLYRRLANTLDRLASKTFILAGGAALNTALGNIIARETSAEVISLQEPQLNGAVGCYTYGEELFKNLFNN